MKLFLSIAATLVMSVVGATACLAAEPSLPTSAQQADGLDEKSRESAERDVREFFGFWKTLYPEFINSALAKMTESNLTSQEKLEEEWFNGSFCATVQIRDTARPDYPSLNTYCYDAATEAVSRLAALRNERLSAKTKIELTNKMIELGNKLSDTTPHAAKPLITYVPGTALLVVYHDAPVQLDEAIGPFSKGFKGYLTTVMVLDITKVLDAEEKPQQ